MSNNTRLAELMNYININTTSGTKLEVSGSIKQTSVLSALLKTDSSGNIVAATAGTDYLTSVGISNLTATGTPSSTTYLRGDNTWATIVASGGTVTSVGLSMPSAFTVSNSPVTGSGTLTVVGAGNTTQYIAGDGSLITFPSLLSSDKMMTVGRNATGATLYKGTIVYISGSTGNRPNFVKAQANAESTSAGTFGVVYADIANNTDGNVVNIGVIDTLDTRSNAANPFTDVTLADGDTIYLHPTIAGYVTNIKPSAPNHLVYVGKVVRTSPTNGTIVYRIQNGYELDEIHDVQVGSYANKDILYRDTTTNLWKNASITTVLGYTPYNSTNPSNYIALTALSSTATGLTYSNTTGVFSLTSGYIIPTTTSATNWDTAYTNRITSLTTTGSSGSASLTTNTLNIPTYTLAGLGGQASSTNLTSLAGLTYASASFVKMTAAGTFSLDTTAYGTGSVTSVSVTTANGVSGTVATSTTTPAITITLGAITPSTVNGLTLTAAATGFTVAGGTTSKTLTVSNTLTFAGTDASTLNIGSGGTLGTAAFTASTAYQASNTNLTSLAGLTYASASFVKMTAAGTFSLDTATYLTASTVLSTAITGYAVGTNTALAATDTILGAFGKVQAQINAKGAGTVTSVGGTGTVSGLTLSGTVTSSGNLTLGGTLSLTSGNVTSALGYTPYNSTNPNGYITSSSLSSYLPLTGGTLTGNLTLNDGLGDSAGGVRFITHSVTKVGSTKFIKIYAGVNNYFTGFLFGLNFDNYPPNSVTSTGSGVAYQFGGYSDGSGVHADKYMDLLHFGGNNVGGYQREMNTDGNGYIITATTSTGAGGFKASATIMLFARDMSQVTITYY
jgi:trimeric autotransporter adhesin